MIKNIDSKSKIKVHWKVTPFDYSKDGLLNIISKLSEKYSLPKDRIKVEPNFISLNEKGEEIPLTSDIIQNIQDPKFQIELFKEYIKLNDIVGYDFSLIEKIDNEINAMINYKVYDKYRRYSINWIKWDNFLSYGENNFFDFSTLKGLILLNGDPANQSGKTTFAIDLVHFLLFGKTDKSATQDKIFNKHIPEATKVSVEGSITIDGVEYIIKRELKRTSLGKRTSASRTAQKVFYYKVVLDGELEELEEYIENETEENNRQTNKVIKDVIGNEDDFDMIICATSSNLDDLIEKKDTERGRLLSRWIGLLPIEEKEQLAREKYNSSIKNTLYSKIYTSSNIQNEIDVLNTQNKSLKDSVNKYENEKKTNNSLLTEKLNLKDKYLELKKTIDESILKIDITTLSNKINNSISNGKKVKSEIDINNEELKNIGDINFSQIEYDELNEKIVDLKVNIATCKEQCISLGKEIDTLTKKEYCPTCGRKFEDVDNSKIILEKTNERNIKINEGVEMNKELTSLNEKLLSLKLNREKYELKNRLITLNAKKTTDLNNLRNEYKELNSLLEKYNENKQAIDYNNDLNIKINNINVEINNLKNTIETISQSISRNEYNIENNNKLIEEREVILKKIAEDAILDKHWGLYLNMIGKNGISKMVLRKALPIINAQITNLLHDVCDFTIDIDITDKNEVMFYLIKDGVNSDLTSGSGFERTAAALALRFVLGNVSTLPKNSGIILDEIWGRIAKENYDNMKKLLDKMLQTYEYIFIITHLDEVKEYCDKIVTVTKTNNISKINIIK